MHTMDELEKKYALITWLNKECRRQADKNFLDSRTRACCVLREFLFFFFCEALIRNYPFTVTNDVRMSLKCALIRWFNKECRMSADKFAGDSGTRACCSLR